MRNFIVRPIAIVALLLVAQVSLFGASATKEARGILDATQIKGGLIVHLGCGDGELSAALRASDSYQVHGLDADEKNVAQARENLRKSGVYGPVAIDRWTGERLPYIDNLVNLIVSEQPLKISEKEVLRVLAPNGVAYVKQGGAWRKIVKPRPKEIDEWTHYLHDAGGNAVAHDDVVGPPRRLQWSGSPNWARHHDHMASMSALVSAGGRVFYIFDEGPKAAIVLPPKWRLIARDAFNGAILWKREIEKWHPHLWPLKSGPAQLPRRLVAAGDRVYVTLGLDAPLTALDAATGKTVFAQRSTAATEELILEGDTLFLVVDENPVTPERASVAAIKSEQNSWVWSAPERKLMAVKADSGLLLWSKTATVSPLTLAADSKQVYYHDGKKVVCLNRNSAVTEWTKAAPRWETIRSYFGSSLVVYDGVVLFSGGEGFVPHRGSDDTMTAFDAENGAVLWTAAHPQSGYQSPEDVLVAGGLVWCGQTTNGKFSGIFTGRNLRTGKVESEFPPDVETHWFHHRCYRGKATDKYLLMSRTGIEFLDIEKKHWIPHHWVRGGCLYGIMPANGLIYAPPHSCACYMEAKQCGFSALAPAGEIRNPNSELRNQSARLERGPAYAKIPNPPAMRSAAPIPNREEWPTYRGDEARSGRTASAVPTKLKRKWREQLGGRLSAVVVAGGKLFVASIDDHTVHALDADSGKPAWHFTAGGRIDSPPTIFQGLAIFGSNDGWVYSLDAATGALAWRFRAAPDERRLTAFEQVESVWPVPGNVLVHDGAVYCVAGRSMFLDGGLRLPRLDAQTGILISETILDDRDPETGKNLQMYVTGLNMTVALPDVLSCDGANVYMRSLPFDLAGVRKRLAYVDVKEQRGADAHLFSPTGFLDGSWWHRSYWIFGRSMASGAGGYHQAGKVAPAARIMVFDDEQVFGFGRKPQYYKWTTPLEYQLFAASKTPPAPGAAARPRASAFGGGSTTGIGVEISDSLNPADKPLAVEAWIRATQDNGAIVARGGPANGYALFLKEGRPHFAIKTKGEMAVASAKKKVPQEWTHLAGVLTADKQLQVYIDGQLAGSAAAPGLLAAEPKQPMEIGADCGGAVGDYPSPFGFSGAIDDVRIYHGSLTAQELSAHAANPEYTAAKDAKLALHFTFDDDDAADKSGNQNVGKVLDAKPGKGRAGKAMRFTGKKQPQQRKKAAPAFIVKHDWTQDLPLQVRAMVLANETLFLVGPPDVLDEEAAVAALEDKTIKKQIAAQLAALEGRAGAKLWAVSAADGQRQSELELDALPVWDGLAAAYGRLYLATTDGAVTCLSGDR